MVSSFEDCNKRAFSRTVQRRQARKEKCACVLITAFFYLYCVQYSGGQLYLLLAHTLVSPRFSSES